MNLFDSFLQTALQQPDHPALVDGESRQTQTYAELLAEVELLANELAAAGIGAADCIGLHVPSGKTYLVLTYALWRCGACVVPIPIELAQPEKIQVCRRIAITGVISPNGSASGFLATLPTQATHSLSVGGFTPLVPEREHPAGYHDLNAAFIRFSSGTTGTSKGVVLSHETIWQRIHAANDVLQVTPADRVVWLLSMSYHFTATIVAYLTFGATVVLPRRGINLGGAILEAAAEHGGTFLYGSPNQYELMAADRSGLMLDRVRIAISTAMSLSPATAEAFYARFQVPISQVYGLIEIGLPCANLQFPREQSESVGQLLPAFELRLTNSSNDRLGEIELRGPGMLDAYYDPWQTRSEIMPNGWFCTGDLGELDERGCLFIRGRSKDVINVLGMKVFPQEVESVLESHPAVREAVVFAARQLERGEAVWARVLLDPAAQPQPSEVELRQFCAQGMAHFKVPERIEFVTELRRTASGKKLRRAIESHS